MSTRLAGARDARLGRARLAGARGRRARDGARLAGVARATRGRADGGADAAGRRAREDEDGDGDDDAGRDARARAAMDGGRGRAVTRRVRRGARRVVPDRARASGGADAAAVETSSGTRDEGRGETPTTRATPMTAEKKKMGKKERRAAFGPSVALNKELMACETLEALAETSRRVARDMSAVNVATTYGKLARFARGGRGKVSEEIKRSEWFAELEERAMEKLGECETKARAVAQIAWACGYLDRGRHLHGEDAFWDELERAIEREISKCEPQGASNVAWAYAKLEMRMPNGIRNAIEKHIVQNASAYKPFELSITFWALTKFGDIPTEEMLDVFEREMRLQSCGSQELTNIASAYARISGRRVRQGTQGFLKELASNAFTILHEFDNTELAMFLWGLSNAGYYLDDDDAMEIFKVVERRASGAKRLEPQQIALITGSFATFTDDVTVTHYNCETGSPLSHLRMSAQTRAALKSAIVALENTFLASIAKCNMDDLSYVMWAFAHLEHRPSDEFVRRLEEEAIDKIEEASAKNLSNLLYGFGTLNLAGLGVFTHAMFCVSQKLEEFTPVGIFMVCSALASSNYDPGPQMMLQFENKLMKSAHAFESQDFTEFLRVFARLRYMLADETFDFIGVSSAKTLDRFDSYRISMTLWSHATLCAQPHDALLARIEDEIRGSASQFKPQNFVLALWSLVLLGSLEDARDSVVRVLHALVKLQGGALTSSEDLEDAQLCSLYMARLTSMGKPFEELILGVTDGVADECERAWLRAKAQDPTISKVQHHIGEVLREIGAQDFEVEALVEGGKIRSDIVFPNSRIVVEVDGPHHYSRDASGRLRELGQTVMRNNLLKSWGWRVVIVPYADWGDMLTIEEKASYLRSLLGDEVFVA